ncbi:DUF1629 domain-containing protein [Fulvivirga sp.]|uniref:imm11 family protein n=1 Tax=Fulvivirga sp. TaxID=1931237 RepID=UPI0032ED6C79
MYYNLRLDWNPKVIGVKNGIYQIELDKGAYSKKTYELIESFFITNSSEENRNITSQKVEFYFKKLKSAKKTNFISFSPNLNNCLFLVNNETRELFKNYKIQEHKFFQSRVYDSFEDNLDDSFQMFYSSAQNWAVIDFENSIFKSGGFGNNPEIEHSFRDENEMRSFNGITQVKTLALSQNFDDSLDLFRTRVGGLFVSEKLKLAIEENEMTGVKFKDDIKVYTRTN